MDVKKEIIYGHAVRFYSAIKSVFKNDAKEKEDVTPILTGMCMGFLKFLGDATSSKGNYLDDIGMVNKIIVQYLMEFGKLVNEDQK